MKKKTKLYLAYGSNLHHAQMAHRCPDAKFKGTVVVDGYELLFRGRKGSGVATIEPSDKDGAHVVGAIWEISERDEKNLDVYEGFPHLYYKVDVPYEKFDGSEKGVAMAYVMHDSYPIVGPGSHYLNIIAEGYVDCGLGHFIPTLKNSAKEAGFKDERKKFSPERAISLYREDFTDYGWEYMFEELGITSVDPHEYSVIGVTVSGVTMIEK